MNQSFDRWYAFDRKEEGGNDDDPEDPGGRTSRGITQREYNAFCGLHKSPLGDVWLMSEDTCKQIYMVSYWNPYCPILPAGLDVMFGDMAVNEGVHEATLTLQRCLHITADGHFGVVTAHASQTVNDVKGLINSIADERIRFYKGLRKFRRFGRGWLNRDAACRALALEMAA